MWETIKRNFARGFGLSLGGALGWRLGNWAANLIGRLWKLIAVSVISVVGMNTWMNSDHMQEVGRASEAGYQARMAAMAKAEQQAKRQQAPQKITP